MKKSSINAAHYNTGCMTIEQANLLFNALPVDITYIDENDKVIFYNKNEDRFFPRGPEIIGRDIRFCHPPKSIDSVLEILEAFKKGKQSEASFWFNYKECLVYVQYFAIRDDRKCYRGIVEITQDITYIKQIQGEKRLLEWK